MIIDAPGESQITRIAEDYYTVFLKNDSLQSGGENDNLKDIKKDFAGLNLEDHKLLVDIFKNIPEKELKKIDYMTKLYKKLFGKFDKNQKELFIKTLKDIITINENIIKKLPNKPDIIITNICVNGKSINGVRQHKKCVKKDYTNKDIDIETIKKIFKKMDTISEKIDMNDENLEQNIEKNIEIINKDEDKKENEEDEL